MKKKIIVALIIAAGISAALIKFYGRQPFRHSGVLEATEISVYSRITDTITEISADEGDTIKKGQALASLECKEISLKAEIAKKEYDRAAQLVKTNAMSQENYDLRKNAYELAETQKSYCQLKSPIDGKVLYRYYEPGELITAGRKLMTIADMSEMEANFYVPHDELANFAIGQKIKAYLPETGQHFDGTITKISSDAEFTPKNVQTRDERTRLVYGIKAKFQNDGKQTLKPGMTVEILPAEELGKAEKGN